MKKDWEYRRGDIYLADLSPVVGSEQGGIRPVVVIQNNIGNTHSPTMVVAPVTTKIDKKKNQPTHCLISKNQAFNRPSMALLEQVRTIDKERVDRYLGKVTQEELRSIRKAAIISMDLDDESHQ